MTISKERIAELRRLSDQKRSFCDHYGYGSSHDGAFFRLPNDDLAALLDIAESSGAREVRVPDERRIYEGDGDFHCLRVEGYNSARLDFIANLRAANCTPTDHEGKPIP